jgi:hypothetical protein
VSATSGILAMTALRRIAIAMSGGTCFEQPAGLPRFLSRILVRFAPSIDHRVDGKARLPINLTAEGLEMSSCATTQH